MRINGIDLKLINAYGERYLKDIKYMTIERHEKTRFEIMTNGYDLIERGEAIIVIDDEATNVIVTESRTIIQKNRTAVTRTVMFTEG